MTDPRSLPSPQAASAASEMRENGAVPSIARAEQLGLLFGAAGIIALTLLAYLPALRNGFIWDDDAYVTNNLTLRSLRGLAASWFNIHALPQYYPMVYSTFWVEYHLWGLKPLGFHLDNILLHGLAAVMLWRILLRLRFIPQSTSLAGDAPAASRGSAWLCGAAWVAAAAFALHPVCVESVAWVTERKNVLMLVFYLLSLWAYLHFAPLSAYKIVVEDRPGAVRVTRPWGWYALSLVFFLAAMLSKTVAASLPVAMLILIWWKRGHWRWVESILLLPFFLIGVPMGLLTAWLEKHNVGAVGIDWTLSPVQRLLIAGRALWFYAGKAVWPAKLSFIYERWVVDPHQWWQWLFPLGVAAAGTGLWLGRRKLGRAPLAAAAFFAVTLAPALGFIDIYPMRYSFVADHFQYVAIIGLIVLAVGVAAHYLARLGDFGMKLGWAVAAAVLLAMGSRTFAQTFVYTNLTTLWSSTIKTSPHAAIAYNNLGLIMRSEGKMDRAIELFEQATAVNPNICEAYDNLAAVLWGRGQWAAAMELVRQSVAINPDYADGHCNLALMLSARGVQDEAIHECREALRCDPGKAEAYHVLGMALIDQGQREQGIGELRHAVALAPNVAGAQHDLGWALAAVGKIDEGIGHLRQAVQLDPHRAGFSADLAVAVAAGERAKR